MIKSSIKIPLMCWRCLSKRVVIDRHDNVVCVEPSPWGGSKAMPDTCGFTVTREKWFELAKGSLPKSGRNTEWTIQVEIPQNARVQRATEPTKETLK